ncbi:MAG: ABC transporter permease [Burkholderiaceae bacterium]
MNAFTALVRKDLVLYFSNRRALLMSIVAPVLIAAFFGSLFGNPSSKPAHIEIAITDLDQSKVSRQIVDAMLADAALTVTEMAEPLADERVRAGKGSAAVTLPQGFGEQAGRAMFGGATKPEIGLRYDPSQSMALQVVRGSLAQYVMQAVSNNVFSGSSEVFTDLRQRALADTTMPAEQRNQLVAMFESIAKVQASTPDPAASASSSPNQGKGGFTIPYATREVEAVGSGPARKYNSYSHSFAGMGVQFVLLMGVDIGIALLMMRRLGLWKRLRAAPLSRADLLGSRIASAALISLVSMAAIYVIAMLGFGVRIDGSLAGFVAVLLAFALMTASFGLLIAAIGKTPEVTRGLAILVTLLMVMLGGAWVPAFIFPAWLQTISLAMPTRWAVDGLDAMTWRGLPLDAAVLPVVVQLGFAALFAALALWRFEWDE